MIHSFKNIVVLTCFMCQNLLFKSSAQTISPVFNPFFCCWYHCCKTVLAEEKNGQLKYLLKINVSCTFNGTCHQEKESVVIQYALKYTHITFQISTIWRAKFFLSQNQNKTSKMIFCQDKIYTNSDQSLLKTKKTLLKCNS